MLMSSLEKSHKASCWLSKNLCVSYLLHFLQVQAGATRFSCVSGPVPPVRHGRLFKVAENNRSDRKAGWGVGRLESSRRGGAEENGAGRGGAQARSSRRFIWPTQVLHLLVTRCAAHVSMSVPLSAPFGCRSSCDALKLLFRTVMVQDWVQE